MLGITAAVITVWLAIFLHESGHALAIRAAGVELEAFGVGIPMPHLPDLTFVFRGVRVIISPLLVGGFVKPTEAGAERMRSLSYSDQALINGAGIMANIFFAGIVVIVLNLVMAWGSWEPVAERILPVAVILVLLWFLRRIFCAYLVPIVGLIELVFVVWIAITHKGAALTGPIGIGTMIVKESPTIASGMFLGAFISFSMGMTNALPFIPLDGGNTWLMILEKNRIGWLKQITRIGTAALIILIGFAFYNDIANLLRK